MVKRITKLGMLLLAALMVFVLGGCSGSTQSGKGDSGSSFASGTAEKGTGFNGGKTPAATFFDGKTYEQQQYNAANLKDEHVSNTDPGSYTVMIYLDGSTDLEDPNYDYDGSIYGSATIDLILSSGVDPDMANIVIMTGGSDAWGHPGLEGNGNYILHVVEDGDGDDLSAEVERHFEEPLNMGDPSTLGLFVDFAEENYPADHYALMIWNHGGGPLLGCAVDENYDEDSLLLPEISDALDATDFGKGKKFDWIGFDCCLMGTLEVADTLSDYSYYMIASQESESSLVGTYSYGTAWVYSFLETLNTTSSPVEIATEAIDRYAESQESIFSDSGIRTEYTLSLMDLTKVEDVETALDALCVEMTVGLEDGKYADLAKLREYTKEFSEGAGFDIVDLGNMTWTLEEMYPDEAESVKNAIEELVLYQRSNVPETSGVSLYYPYRNIEVYDELGGRELYTQLNISDGYLTYLDEFTDILINGEKDADCEIDTPEPESEENQPGSSDEYTLHLSEEQQKGIARISYNVLQQGNDDDDWTGGSERYRILLQDCQVAVDDEGVAHFPKNQTLLTLENDNGEQIVWSFRQVASGAQTAKYQSLATTVDGPFGPLAWTESVPAAICATEDLTGGKPIISSIVYLGKDGVVEGKSDVDLERYDYLSNWAQPCAPKGDAPEPAWDWESWGGLVVHPIAIDSGLTIGTTTTAELEGDYVLQVVITDIYGKEYVSDLYELESLGAPVKEEANIGGVNCTFTIYDDHVVLADAEGSANEFSIPYEYQGKPVVEIGNGAFSKASIKSVSMPDSVKKIGKGAFSSDALESVSLPEGLRAIGPSAFAGCSNLTNIELPESLQWIGDSAFGGCEHLEALEIPASVTYIGDGAFQECSRLRHLTVAEGNKAFKAEENDDGNVIYTADGTELVSCPGLFHSTYRVAEGTERIRDRAFFGCYTENLSGKADGSEGKTIVGYGLVSVEFPSTLKEIGDAAFFECNRLERITLPEGLEIIGMEAFGSTDLTETIGTGTVKYEKDAISEVRIGKNVRWVGQAAFNSFDVEKFVVDEENQHYSSDDGRLMSKDGETEIDVYGGSFGISEPQ